MSDNNEYNSKELKFYDISIIFDLKSAYLRDNFQHFYRFIEVFSCR